MEDGRIHDDSITASSYYEERATHAPVRARLNTKGETGTDFDCIGSNGIMFQKIKKKINYQY